MKLYKPQFVALVILAFFASGYLANLKPSQPEIIVGGASLSVMATEFDKSELKNKYQLNGTSLKREIVKNAELTSKGEIKDKITVTLGEEPIAGMLGANPDFTPSIKLARWDEVDFKLTPRGLDQVPAKNKTLQFLGDKVRFDTPKASYEMYEVPATATDKGSYKYVWYLNEKPASNIIEFDIETAGLDFFYQPALNQENTNPNLTCTETQCKDKDGNVVMERPIEVVGSYAVYHSTKGGMNDKDGKDYKTGKAFHIYRPHIIDSEGRETWGILKIENGIYSVEIPQDFLDKAVYPIKSNDTFGYTSVGASTANIYYNSSYLDNAQIEGSDYTLSAAGTVSKLSVYVSALPAAYTDCTVFGGIFDSGTAEPFERIGESVSQTGITSTGWKDLIYGTSPSLSAADYKLCTYSDCDGTNNYNSLKIAYDETGGINSVQRLGSGMSEASSMANTLTNAGDGNGPVYYYINATQGSRKPSIYATYTPSGGGETAPAQDVIFFD